MKKISAEARILLTLFASVFVVGLVGLNQLLASPGMGADEALAQSQEQSMLGLDSGRQPASLHPQKAAAIPSLSRSICDLSKTNEKTNIQGAFFQLKLSRCGGLSKKQNSEVVILNLTNGFTASVFSLSTGELQTDLIQLQEGSNEILIKHFVPDGTLREEKISVSSVQKI